MTTTFRGAAQFAASTGRQRHVTPAGVYVIAPRMEGPCKIGIAEDLARRLDALQMGCWEKLHVAFFAMFYVNDEYIDLRASAYRLEQRTHKNLRKCDVGLHGEWFDISVKDAIAAVRKTAKQRNIVEVTGDTIAMQEPKTKGERIAYGLKREILETIQRNEATFEIGSSALTGPEGCVTEGILARGYVPDFVMRP